MIEGKSDTSISSENVIPDKKISLSGEISGYKIKSYESELFETLKKMTEGTTLALDMIDVQRIDSRGITLIVGLYKECTLRKVTLTINAGSVAYKILSQLKLDREITIKEGH